MATVDLHLHSDRSDGEYAPAEVVRLAAAAGLRVIALTDHDTTDGIAEALAEVAALNAEASAPNAEAAAVDAGGAAPDAEASAALAVFALSAAPARDRTRPAGPFVCLPGVEITTEHAREQHLLGYLVDCESKPFRDFMKRLMALRRERADNILEYLNKKNVPLSYRQVRRLSDSGYIGRPQIAGALVRMGKAASIQEAFAEYLTGDEFRKVPRPKPTAEESIAAIRAAGGVAVLAHPDSLRLSGAELEARLKTLKGQGLAGLECHYGTYDRGQTKDYVRLANKLGLIVTGGSDFHGPHVKPDVLIATGKDGMLDFDDMTVIDRLKAAASRPG
jgi:predicted metal-dependent phosphoesterase TrpH